LKILVGAVRIVFILSLPAFFISASLALAFNSHWLYEYGFHKYRVSQTTGISQTDLDKSAAALIDYFNDREEFAVISVVQNGQTTQLLSPDEQLHFRDVKALVWLDYKVLMASFGMVLCFSLWSVLWRHGLNRHRLARSFIWGSALAIAAILALGVGSLFDFEGLFLQFHYLAFNNNYWYAPGNMTLLFPEGFWMDAALICLGFVAFLAVLSGTLSAVYLTKEKRTKKRLT
jgi:integral membrane protein (TIGR01906 family)